MKLSGRFRDRREAGSALAEELTAFGSLTPVILGLPRGGVVVAAEVAKALRAPLDVILVRKLGVPYQPELAMGAIGEDDVRVLDRALIAAAGLSEREVEEVERRERDNLAEAAARFRGDRPPIELNGKIAVIVDDGIATGATARAACEVVHMRSVRQLVVAAPVASRESADRLRAVADDVTVLATPSYFLSISQFYDNFSPVSDEEVVACLNSAAVRMAGN